MNKNLDFEMVFEEISKKEITPFLIASYLYKAYKGIHLYLPEKKSYNWYIFENHRWSFLNTFLLESSIINFLQSLEGYFRNNHLKNKINYSLEFKSKILKEYEKICFNMNFYFRKDKNYKLVCFRNGVYDLENNVFRNGLKEDYITKYIDYYYVPYDEQNDINIELEKYLDEIFDDESIKKNSLVILSDSLVNASNKNILLYGNAHNSIKNFFCMIKNTFGDYFIDLNHCKEPYDNTHKIAFKKYHIPEVINDEPYSIYKKNMADLFIEKYNKKLHCIPFTKIINTNKLDYKKFDYDKLKICLMSKLIDIYVKNHFHKEINFYPIAKKDKIIKIKGNEILVENIITNLRCPNMVNLF